MNIERISFAPPPKPSEPAAPTPPPGGNVENRQPPAEPSAPTAPSKPATTGQPSPTGSQSAGVNDQALRSLQQILQDSGDPANLNTQQKSALTSRLQKAGLLNPGALFDVLA